MHRRNRIPFSVLDHTESYTHSLFFAIISCRSLFLSVFFLFCLVLNVQFICFVVNVIIENQKKNKTTKN